MWRPPLSPLFTPKSLLIVYERTLSLCRSSTVTYRFFMAVNGYKNSSHCVFSTSSYQSGHEYRSSWMSRRSKKERGPGGKDELQTCIRDESCQSDSVHKISNVSHL